MNRLRSAILLLALALLAACAQLTPGDVTGPTVTGDPFELSISEIQGNGQFSPFAGKVVTTTGVVTLISANGRDMWIQDPAGDGDPATSDGIFVDDRDRLSVPPQVGDLVRVTAEVEEQQFGNSLPLTRLDDPDDYPFEILSSGNPLPDPVLVSDLPDSSIADAIAFWEPLEGMLATVENAPVVAATSRFGEFAMLARDDAVPGSGFYPQVQQILVRNLGGDVVDYNPERILVDDASLDEAIEVRPGDRVRSLVGVVDYTFGNYKLQPANYDINTHDLPRTPASTRSGPSGNTVITSFNVENLFDLVDEPLKDDEGSTPTASELETQLSKLALSIEVELELPEIIVVQEVENQAILQVLGDRVNDATGSDYTATSFETSDGRGIEAGFLWDASRVNLLDAFQLSGPDVENAFGPSSASPGREPVVGTFDILGNTVTIVGNHFKSKGGDDPLFGVNQPPTRITEEQRKQQALVVRNYVDSILDADPEALVMVTGDLNDFQFSEPGEGTDHPVAILEGGPGEVPLTNLIELERDAERFTFVFDGNSQVLDHTLVSPALLERFVAVDVLHFNAGFPDALGEDPTTSLRASDHDPLESRFDFEQSRVDFTLTLLHNNDGESDLIDLGSGLEDFGGVARFKTLVDQLRDAANGVPRGGRAGVVVVSSGDNFLAGPEFNASLDKGVPFYDTIALDLIGYDAIAIGNHEFDFGPDVLADFIEGFAVSRPPYLSANLDFSGEPRLQELYDQGRIAASTVVGIRGEEIGIVGATTPNLRFISSPRNVVVDPDVAGAVQREVDALEASGVDKIILISHLQDINGDIALAALLDGVDVMVAGGGDEVLANPGDLLVPGDEGEIFGTYPVIATDIDGTEVPVVTTAGSYGYVGRLVVDFDADGNVIGIGLGSGPVRVAGGSNPDAVAPDPVVQAAVVDPVADAVAALATNVLAASEVALNGVRSEVRSRETNEGDLIADSLLWQARQLAASFGVAAPDVALQNGGGIRNDSIIPAGLVTELDTFSMVPFPNFVTVLEDIPREQFKEILENAVSRTQPGDTPGGTGRFAQIAGFTFVWSGSGTAQVLNLDGTVATAGTRVQTVVLDDGTPIVSGGSVLTGSALTVATIDFLARGGDEYPYRGAPFTTLGVSYQQALANYLADALGGSISAADYPEGGEGRSVELP